MIDLDSGPIHLSYDPGAGATTLCLSIASSTLISGNRVIWIAREVPDSTRAGQILGSLDESDLSRMVIIQIKGGLRSTDLSVRSFLGKMRSSDLVIVDDWCPRSGKAPKEEVEGMIGIIKNARSSRIGIIFTSPAYEDPTGFSGRRCRSERSFTGIARTVFLSRRESQNEIRVLDDNGEISELLISEEGFFPI